MANQFAGFSESCKYQNCCPCAAKSFVCSFQADSNPSSSARISSHGLPLSPVDAAPWVRSTHPCKERKDGAPSVWDGANRASRKGWATRRTLPLNMAEPFTYDEVGNLKTHTDFNGKTTTFAYDQLNRLKSKVPDPSLSQPTISFTYYPTGTRQTMVDGTGTTNYLFSSVRAPSGPPRESYRRSYCLFS